MSEAQEIKDLADSLDPDITFTLEACETLVVVPAMFRKMAMKTVIKGAKEDGVTEITLEYAKKYKP